jgi:hypothetical protein
MLLTLAITIDPCLMAQTAGRFGKSVGDSVGDSVRQSAAVRPAYSGGLSPADRRVGIKIYPWMDINIAIGASIRKNVEAALADGFSSVAESVWRGVAGVIQTSLVACVRNSIWRNAEYPWDCVRGQHIADQLVFYSYVHDVLGLTGLTARMSGVWELAQSAGWALPHRSICWVSERPGTLVRDDRGRLHSLAGPACTYPDGWEIHAVRGVCVPAYVVERPAEISIERIDGEDNVEVRRVMIERYRLGEEMSGAAAWIRDAGGERLDHDETCGTLWRRNVPDDEPIVMVEVVNSTPEPDGSRKRYWLRVPSDMRTARDAVAWTFGLSGGEYDPLEET